MSESKNIQIPISLFRDVVGLLEKINIGDYKIPRLYNLDGILSELRKKLDNINLRYAYSNIVHAKYDEQRYLARNTYVKLKNNFNLGRE
ncbi:MAG: hypothetical protein LBI03_00270 [Clostridiales bacterium]|jgi:hypothetical protein|nr:hypothetical protein [Clostridiales bacterium]